MLKRHELQNYAPVTLALAGAFLLFITGCGDEHGAVTLSSLAVTPTDVSIAKETTKQFAVTGTYSDGTTQDLTSQVTWSSSDTAVATIDSSGLATAVGSGSTTVMATSGSVSATATLTVTTLSLTTLALTPTDVSIAKETTRQFTATGTFSDDSTQDLTSQVTWSSSDTAVATINSSGLATAVGSGSTTVTATSGSVSATTTLTVTALSLTTLAVTPTTASIAKGLTQQFTVTGTFSDNTTQNLTTQVTWSSSNTSVATIDSKGLATSAAVGSTTLTATSGSVSATATLTVTAATLSSIAITGAASAIFKGATQQFTATGTYTDSTTQSLTTQVAWSSSNTTVATIGSTTGLATSVLTTVGGNVTTAGSTNISATFGGITQIFALTVNRATLPSIQANVLTPKCAYCHNTADQGTRAQLDLSSGNTYTDAVDVAGFGGTCVGNGNLKRIKPNDPDNSCLVRRIKGTLNIMPPATETTSPISALDIETITDWVSRGAPETN